ncbi:hypothetical protein [Candidatus Ichthyocystis hellenicum]|uniref:hypothetical protein n=1 Tax=Candidatus Ichthyocystis hellenicum TaxID=1561003 RepID=UPI000B80628C|nr:hypothetical protein [Candidatus Ichthyocystis hellenicum]
MRPHSPSFSNEKIEEETTDTLKSAGIATSSDSIGKTNINSKAPYLSITTESKASVVMRITTSSKPKIKKGNSLDIKRLSMPMFTPQTKRITGNKGYNQAYPAPIPTGKTSMFYRLSIIISSSMK